MEKKPTPLDHYQDIFGFDAAVDPATLQLFTDLQDSFTCVDEPPLPADLSDFNVSLLPAKRSSFRFKPSIRKLLILAAIVVVLVIFLVTGVLGAMWQSFVESAKHQDMCSLVACVKDNF
jgi:hypothetical protein